MKLLISAAFVLCWSSGFIGAKLGAGSAATPTLLMWRFLPLALLLLTAAALLRAARRRTAARVPAPPREAVRSWSPRSLARQTLIGLLSQSGYLLSVYYAIQLGVSSGTTALIDGTQPLVAGALAGPLLGQYVTRRQWLGLGLGVSGVLVVTLADAADSQGVDRWAYLVPFAGMLALVAATFLQGSRAARAPSPVAALTVHVTTSAVVFSALALVTGTAVPPAEPRFWWAVAWLVVLSTFGGYGLYWLILRRSGVTRVNTLMFLMAPVTALWGALMFGETFGPGTVLGLALALAAVRVVHRGAAGSMSGPAAAETPAGHGHTGVVDETYEGRAARGPGSRTR
ncbi:integral membrane protein [Streptomyces albus]|uniref:Integral membrane protein n=1 Tax=Streptomyces albus (strain ATCC 21838 / DSM 41398 / FERM P-419 / JCM 4703 / NBRC 107858) TaxID=1081613 RepID=A0A0B5F5W1_STRA4|nr:integral membrane protein [Streptomyces albus]AOU80583.1 integral membrane protein [Streptomyces albus]AYN36293.1 EamA/RhaT family transporter [Streptomyces albus]